MLRSDVHSGRYLKLDRRTALRLALIGLATPIAGGLAGCGDDGGMPMMGR